MKKHIKLGRRWKDYHKHIIQRLHDIVSGVPKDGPFEKDSGYHWMLDSSNNWWADFEGETLVLAARYEYQPFEEVAALAERLFGPESDEPGYVEREDLRAQLRKADAGGVHRSQSRLA
jgi:hypothetical protein